MKRFLVLALMLGMSCYFSSPIEANQYNSDTLLAYRGGRSSGFSSGRSSSRGGYSSGRSSSSNKSSSFSSGRSSSSSKSQVPSGTYNSRAGTAARKSQSQATYQKATKPKSSFTTKSGKTVKVNPNSASTKKLRSDFTSEKYATRNSRASQTFVNINTNTIPNHYYNYSDPYGAMFFTYLMASSLQQQALWSYHHKDEMDDARWQEMCKQNAQLAAEVEKLKASGAKVDPNYAPDGVDHDLQFSDSYVNAVVGPTEASSPGAWTWFWVVLGIFVVGAVIFWLVTQVRFSNL